MLPWLPEVKDELHRGAQRHEVARPAIASHSVDKGPLVPDECVSELEASMGQGVDDDRVGGVPSIVLPQIVDVDDTVCSRAMQRQESTIDLGKSFPVCFVIHMSEVVRMVRILLHFQIVLGGTEAT